MDDWRLAWRGRTTRAWWPLCARSASIPLPDLLSTYAGQAAELRPWLVGAEINRDGNLRLQYLAGLALNDARENSIYNEIGSYRRFPDNLFAGSSEAELAALFTAMATGQHR